MGSFVTSLLRNESGLWPGPSPRFCTIFT